jgi:hypothetical protein
MRKILILTTIFLMSGVAYSQDCPDPAGCVTITRQAALKALTDADKVKALETEAKAKDAAIATFRDELNQIRIEFARASGENTILKQQAVADRAMLELLLKQTRKKCYPLTICF